MALCSSFQLTRVAALAVQGSASGGDVDPRERLPWPDNIIVYLPSNEQLSADYMSRCLSVISVLKLCNLKFDIHRCRNAEFLAPDKLWPLLRSGENLATGFENIVDYIRILGYLPSRNYSEMQQAEMMTFLIYIDSTMYSAERFLCWCSKNEFQRRTKPRHFSFYSKPLRIILPLLKAWETKTNLNMLGYPSDKTGHARVFQELRTLCKSVTAKLQKSGGGEESFLFGPQITEVDVVFACHVEAIKDVFDSFSELSKLFNSDFPHLLHFSKKCMDQLSNPKVLLK